MLLVQSGDNSYRAVPITGAQYDALVAYDAALAAHFDAHGSYDGAPDPAPCIATVVAEVLLPPMVVSEREAAEWADMLSAQEESDRRDLDFSRGLVAQ